MGDWFGQGDPSRAVILTADALVDRARYGMLLCSDANGVQRPDHVYIEPQTLSDGRVVEGYSVKYANRVQLLVTPTDRPIDLEVDLREENPVTTDGRSRVYYETAVRGVVGVARDAGVQKWESGAENRFPSVIEWVERSDGPAPYLRYSLLGDITVAELADMAERMVFRAKPAER
jgi:hypothetical protein